MPDPIPRLRVVGEAAMPPRRGRGPGLAVIFIGLYALLFAGVLWLLRAQIPGWHRAASGPPASARAGRPDRQGLLSGDGLMPEARSEYLRLLATDCCDCGCELRLHECLAGDEKCVRSVEVAARRLTELK
jgi:hypothetical protein